MLACEAEQVGSDTRNDTSTLDGHADSTTTVDGTPAEPQGACVDLAATCLSKQQACEVKETGQAECHLCPEGEHPDRDTATCAPIGGIAHVHDFGSLTLQPGEEISSVCRSWFLNNPEELWIHAVEFKNDGGYHHSNWVFIPEDFDNYPGDMWYDCYGDGFHEVNAGLAGGVIYAQSTQATHEVQKFGEGTAIRVPPYSRIIAPTHLLNYFPEPLTTQMVLTLYEIPAEAVTTKLTPVLLTNRSLKIKPNVQSEFKASCDFEDHYSTFFDGPMKWKLHYALPHYHNSAISFRLSFLGGKRDGETIFETDGYNKEPFGRIMNPPLDMEDSTGLTFSCIYLNTSSKTLKWGIGANEMCDMLGFIESPTSMIGLVETSTLVDSTDEKRTYDGNCNAIAVEFNQDK
jgi:hypothetical protein